MVKPKKSSWLHKKWALLSLIIAVGLISFVGFYHLGNNSNPDSSNASSCEGYCVSLKNNGADPRELAIPVGSFVQFNSADGESHNISLGEGGKEHDHSGPFHSGEFTADEAWRVQFKEEGSFYFHDHLNPKINVLVVVYTPGKDYKIN